MSAWEAYVSGSLQKMMVLNVMLLSQLLVEHDHVFEQNIPRYARSAVLGPYMGFLAFAARLWRVPERIDSYLQAQ